MKKASLKRKFKGNISMTNELINMSAIEVCDLLKKKEIRPTDLLEASLNRILATDKIINAIPTLCVDRAYEQAKTLEKSNRYISTLLGGIPICVKDLTTVAGVRNTWGTKAYKNYIAPTNDPIVDRLESNGAIIIGKSNTPEMGAGNTTSNEIFGTTRNPWDITKNPGGSSGGSAAAVASGLVWLGHGTDLAGSLRNPAAYCGVVALRPSPGRAGGPPQSVLFNTETVHGPMGRNVVDIAIFLDAMVGFDKRIPISIEAPPFSFYEEIIKKQNGQYKIAFSMDLNGFANAEHSIKICTENAIKCVSSEKLFSVEYEAPQLPKLYETYTVLRSMLWGSGPGSQPDYVQKHYKASLKRNISDAQKLKSSDIYNALTNRSVIYTAIVEFFERYDCLACPVIGKEAGPIDEEYPKEIAGDPIDDYVDWLRFSFLAPTAGLPAISLPIGFGKNGLPIGIQLIGKPRGEKDLLIIAHQIERLIGFEKQIVTPRV